MRDSLGEADEVLMVGVHVSQLAVDEKSQLLSTLKLHCEQGTILES